MKKGEKEGEEKERSGRREEGMGEEEREEKREEGRRRWNANVNIKTEWVHTR